jgi:hypothetical protein
MLYKTSGLTAGKGECRLGYTMKKTLPLSILVLAALTACGNGRQQEPPGTASTSKPDHIQETPITSTEAAESTSVATDADAKLATIIEQARIATTEADIVAVEKVIASIESAGMLDMLGTALEKKIMEHAGTGVKAAPGLQIALSAVYGRKGMAQKAYAAILEAEKTASEPGVSFNLAAIHGRKALLAPKSRNNSFSLIVRCEIPNAVVTIDGVEQGSPPIRLEALREGRHEVRIQSAGYEPYLRTVEGTDGETIELETSLDAIPASLSVTALPAGAAISLDGIIVGESSWEGTLVPGMHTIAAALARHVGATKTVEALPGRTIEAVSFNLAPLPSYVRVTTSIQNVEVYLDGALKGVAPLRLDVPAGNSIRIRVAPIDWWYEAQQRIVTVGVGEERSENFELVHGKATANFIADMNVPRGARVYIDGVLRGTVPFSIPDFPLGVYELRIEASGYEPYRLKWGFTGTQLAITPMKRK